MYGYRSMFLGRDVVLIPCFARNVERVLPITELPIARTGVWRMIIPVTLSIMEDCSRFGSRIGFWKWENL